MARSGPPPHAQTGCQHDNPQWPVGVLCAQHDKSLGLDLDDQSLWNFADLWNFASTTPTSGIEFISFGLKTYQYTLLLFVGAHWACVISMLPRTRVHIAPQSCALKQIR